MINKSKALLEMEKRDGLEVDDLPRRIEVFHRNDDDGIFIVKDIALNPMPLFLLRNIFPNWINGEKPDLPDEPLFLGYTTNSKNIISLFPFFIDTHEVLNFDKYEYFFTVASAEYCEEFIKRKKADPNYPSPIQFKSEPLPAMEQRLGLSVNELPRRILCFNIQENNFFLLNEITLKPVPISLLHQVFVSALKGGEYPDEACIGCYEVTLSHLGLLYPYFLQPNTVLDFERYRYYFTVGSADEILAAKSRKRSNL